MEQHWRKTTVIVPAFNEAEQIAPLLENICKMPWRQVIVVDDGSRDPTSQIVKEVLRPGDYLISYHQNRGKGWALWLGLQSTQTPWVVFMDADLQGVTQKHIEMLCGPVWSSEAKMGIAVLGERNAAIRCFRYLGGIISGQRCLLKKDAFRALRHFYDAGYGVEIGITLYAYYHHWPITRVVWDNVVHPLKEKKYGVLRGLIRQGMALSEIGWTGVRAAVAKGWIGRETDESDV